MSIHPHSPSFTYGLFISISFALLQTFITFHLAHWGGLLVVFCTLPSNLLYTFLPKCFFLKFNSDHVTPHYIESNAKLLSFQNQSIFPMSLPLFLSFLDSSQFGLFKAQSR